jgi:hypothetical protein
VRGRSSAAVSQTSRVTSGERRESMAVRKAVSNALSGLENVRGTVACP